MALLKGTLDVLVLKTLSWTPMHAFEITSWIEERSTGRVAVDDAACSRRCTDRRAPPDRRRVGRHEERPPRAVLQAHARRTRAPRAESDRLVDHFDAVVTILGAKKA